MLMVSAFLVSCGEDRETVAGMTEPTAKIRLYPEGQDVDMGIVEDGVQITSGPVCNNHIDTLVTEDSWAKIGDNAWIELYIPEKCNGQMVVVCPGGGYNTISYYNEGTHVAYHLTQRGYAACVVVYRMPNYHHQLPLTDVQNAFRYCRYHAADWGVDQIGIFGGSAGAHLAACASTLYEDEVTRPDFSILLYGVLSFDVAGMGGGTRRRLTTRQDDEESLVQRYSCTRNVTPDTPPTFLALSADDKTVSPEYSIEYYRVCRANGVPVQMHIYPSGGHGWGFSTPDLAEEDKLGPYRQAFFDALFAFLESLRPEA